MGTTYRHIAERQQERSQRMLAALRRSLAPADAAVQKACGNCGLTFTTTNAAQHDCDVCTAREEAA